MARTAKRREWEVHRSGDAREMKREVKKERPPGRRGDLSSGGVPTDFIPRHEPF